VESVHVNEALKQTVRLLFPYGLCDMEAGVERTGTALTLAESGLKYSG
jgi:hypothetical protein